MMEKFACFVSGLLWGAILGCGYAVYRNETEEERALDEKRRKEAREFVKDVMSA